MDDSDNDGQSLVPLDVPSRWFSPWNYPSMCSNDLCIEIASDIARGASFNAAAMRSGVSPKRARQWLKWGDEAYDRDVDGNDRDAPYLNFFLKMMQAVGFAGVQLQQQTRLESPGWWLTHNPEQRGEWGNGMTITNKTQGSLLTSSIDADPNDVNTVDSPTTQPTTLPTPSPESVRAILKTLISSGAAIGPEDIQNSKTG